MTNYIKAMIRHATDEPVFQPITMPRSHFINCPLCEMGIPLVGKAAAMPDFDYASFEQRLKDFFELELALDRWLGIEQKTFVLDSMALRSISHLQKRP